MDIPQALKNFAQRRTVSSLAVSSLGMLTNDRVLRQVEDLDEAGILDKVKLHQINEYIYNLPTRDAILIAARNNPAVLAELIDQWLKLVKDASSADRASALELD